MSVYNNFNQKRTKNILCVVLCVSFTFSLKQTKTLGKGQFHIPHIGGNCMKRCAN